MFMFAVSPDVQLTVRRLVITSLLLLFWLWQGMSRGAGFDWSWVALTLIPNPWGFWTTLRSLVDFLGTFGVIYFAILLMLQMVHAIAVASLAIIWWRQWRPVVTGATTRALNTARLARPWFLTPLLMTLWLVVLFYLLPYWLLSAGQQGPFSRAPSSLPMAMVSFGPYPLYWALGFAALGLLVGWARITQTQQLLSQGTGAKPLANDHPLTMRVHALAAKLALPPPQVGVTSVANAFAAGMSRDKAMVVLGVPLIRGLTSEELDAVIAHELAHIVSGDMQQMQFAEGYQSGFASFFGGLGRVVTGALAQTGNIRSRAAVDLGFMISDLVRYTLFFGAELIVKGLSRSREFHADAIGASITSPRAMASVLSKLPNINDAPTPIEKQYACLMFRGHIARAFGTHPPLDSRIKALETRAYIDMLPRK
jgi:heat shock protein HtpX